LQLEKIDSHNYCEKHKQMGETIEKVVWSLLRKIEDDDCSPYYFLDSFNNKWKVKYEVNSELRSSTIEHETRHVIENTVWVDISCKGFTLTFSKRYNYRNPENIISDFRYRMARWFRYHHFLLR